MEQNKPKIDKNRIMQFIFLVLLLVYPLRHIWLGVELTDGAYSAGNFRFPEHINSMWFFSTYIANELGALLIKLPFGDRLMGLNFYTSLVISIIAISMYLFLTKIVHLNRFVVFVGEILAISLCWCPTTSLYNYLTYFFFNIGIIFLVTGLMKEKRVLLFLAGICLGMNVFVRFPNLAEAALILALWYYGYLMHKRFKDVVQETLICLLGYVAGAALILTNIAVQYGMDNYITGIMRLMNMPSDASDYSLYSMVITVVMDYWASSKWLFCLIILVVLGLIIFSVLEAGFWQEDFYYMLLYRGLRVAFVAAVLAMFVWWYKLGVFNVRYYTYESMFQWVAVFLLISIIVCLYVIFSRKYIRNDKLLAAVTILLIGVTPLGSNNHLYPNMNNMFLVFPFVLILVLEIWQRLYAEDIVEVGRFISSSFPIRAALILFLGVLCIQCVGFGVTFTFRDGMSGQKRNTKIENNDILKGMVTNQPLAEAVEGLTEYIEGNGLQNKEVILYGHIPAASYILDMPSAITTTWPDLASYGYEIFAEDMDKVAHRLDEMLENPQTYIEEDRPLVIIGAGLDAWLLGDAEAMDAAELTEAQRNAYAEDEKLVLLTQYMENYGYTRSYANSRFAVYE